jgi:hypothetical protein
MVANCLAVRFRTIAALVLQLLLPLVSTTRSGSTSYRSVCSGVRSEEAHDKKYDDHDDDDVENVIVYSDRGMRDFDAKARCSNRKRLETILSSGAHEAKRREGRA